MEMKNEKCILKVMKLTSDAITPRYVFSEDAGADLHAIGNHLLKPLKRKIISTGISVEVPKGFEIQIRSKSGMASISGVSVLNAPGTIDAGYRGEIKVILINLGSKDYKIRNGQKIAQIVVSPIIHAEIIEVKSLSETDRGEDGLGSTG